MRIAYFDCSSGVSGDMLLASMLDAGLALDDLRADLAHLDMGPHRLVTQRVTSQGLTGTQLLVLEGAGNWPVQNLPAIERIIGTSDLPGRVQRRSQAVFRRLAAAEAKIHGSSMDQVHFHDVGAVDSLVDIVGFVCALERMGLKAVYSSPLPLGSGSVKTDRGLLPAPAPATPLLLAEVGAPTVPGPARTGQVTPTAAALLSEFSSFERPPMDIQAVGYGFGTEEFDEPNALRVWLGEPSRTL